MTARTVFLSKLIGLYCIVVSLSVFTNKQMTVETVTALINNRPLLYVVGVMAVAAGLAMVLSHNVWSGGALPVIVTLIGWLTLIKGMLFFFLSPEAEARVFLTGLHYEAYFYVYAAISLLLGIYLTYGGFRQQRGK
jgi:vacuolar-type H+-ATPase subunit I/STV1